MKGAIALAQPNGLWPASALMQLPLHACMHAFVGAPSPLQRHPALTGSEGMAAYEQPPPAAPSHTFSAPLSHQQPTISKHKLPASDAQLPTHPHAFRTRPFATSSR